MERGFKADLVPGFSFNTQENGMLTLKPSRLPIYQDDIAFLPTEGGAYSMTMMMTSTTMMTNSMMNMI